VKDENNIRESKKKHEKLLVTFLISKNGNENAVAIVACCSEKRTVSAVFLTQKRISCVFRS